MKKKIAIIGSVGVPASYGGFESLVENIIGDNCSKDIEYTVYCSTKHYYERPKVYKGAKLKYIHLNANGIFSILYDGVSLFKSLRGFHSVVVLGVPGGLFFPLFKLFSGAKLIVNIDGLEWKRGKWNGLAKLFLRISEEAALRFSDAVIADNQAIVDYIKRRYLKKTVLIAYGGDHAKRELPQNQNQKILSKYELRQGEYSISVCRIEPENNCDMILEGFASTDQMMVMIGNFNNSHYGLELKQKYESHANIKLLDAIYDLDILYALRSSCRYYIHGHSAGGSNPSLIEAMFCGCSILAYDVIFNRNTTGNQAAYFGNKQELASLLKTGTYNSEAMLSLANSVYTWESIAQKYESLY
ncbi:MAG: DUF1972 domain-containing protein [Rikenellaceae bacterium]